MGIIIIKKRLIFRNIFPSGNFNACSFFFATFSRMVNIITKIKRIVNCVPAIKYGRYPVNFPIIITKNNNNNIILLVIIIIIIIYLLQIDILQQENFPEL